MSIARHVTATPRPVNRGIGPRAPGLCACHARADGLAPPSLYDPHAVVYNPDLLITFPGDSMPPRPLALALTCLASITTLACASARPANPAAPAVKPSVIRREPGGAPGNVLCGIDVLERNGFKPL